MSKYVFVALIAGFVFGAGASGFFFARVPNNPIDEPPGGTLLRSPQWEKWQVCLDTSKTSLRDSLGGVLPATPLPGIGPRAITQASQEDAFKKDCQDACVKTAACTHWHVVADQANGRRYLPAVPYRVSCELWGARTAPWDFTEMCQRKKDDPGGKPGTTCIATGCVDFCGKGEPQASTKTCPTA